MKYKEKIANKIVVMLCIAFLAFECIFLGVRFLSRQIVIERMGITNRLTELIFFDDEKLGDPSVPEDTFDSTKDRIENFVNDHIPWQKVMSQGAMYYDKYLGWDSPVRPEDFNRIITMKNGWLTYVQPAISEEDVNIIADSVSDFNEYLSQKGIGFVYINMGSKVNPSDKELSDLETRYEYTNENGDALLKALSERNVPTLDIRESLMKSNRDWYSSFYLTDHHWTPDTGRWVAGQIAAYLNEEMGLSYNLSLFDEGAYEYTTYEGVMFGGEGRTVTLAKAKPEAYTEVMPAFATNLRYEIPSRNQVFEGEYKVALFDCDLERSTLSYKNTDFLYKEDIYNSIRLQNYPLSVITNMGECNNKDVKILMIEDSFSWYSTSFLACDTGEIDIIYPIEYLDSIRDYVENSTPDIVILSSCEKAINPIVYTKNDSYFDLR